MEQNIAKNKKPSMELWFNFVESLVYKYRLEDELINGGLSQQLNGFQPAENYLFERASLKLISNNIRPFLQTSILQGILTNLINKKINFVDLPSIVQNKLKVSPEIAEKISEEIKNNSLVLKEINEDTNSTPLSDDEFENYLNNLLEENVPEKKQSRMGLNQDLL